MKSLYKYCCLFICLFIFNCNINVDDLLSKKLGKQIQIDINKTLPDVQTDICSNIVTTEVDSYLDATIIPTHVQDMFEGQGNQTSDTIIVYLDGGPMTNLGVGGINNYDWVKDKYVAYVHQSNSLNPNLLRTPTSVHNRAQSHRDNEISAFMACRGGSLF